MTEASATVKPESVPIEEWSGELIGRCKDKYYVQACYVSVAKASLKGRPVPIIRPEAKWSMPGQSESLVTGGGGSKRRPLKRSCMSWV